MTYHGGAPRVRRRENNQEGGKSSTAFGIELNGELIANKVADAVISAGVAYLISRV